jgi:hypothetical protein
MKKTEPTLRPAPKPVAKMRVKAKNVAPAAAAIPPPQAEVQKAGAPRRVILKRK